MAEVTPTPPRLETLGLTKRFGATLAVDGVDFRVRSGEVRALVGENGAGKTTLMNLLSGVDHPDHGEIRLDGEPYRPSSPKDARASRVSMVHQELALAPHLSVAENVCLGVEPTRFGWLQRHAMRARARKALASLGHDDIDPDVSVGSLGIAARQIVEIARAVLLDARVLILDEPTSCLSRPDIERLFRLVGRLKAGGLAVIYISHFLDEIFEVADSFTVLRDGRVVSEGSLAETTVSALVRAMVGRDVETLYPRSSRTPGDTVLTVDSFVGAPLPRAASFQIRRGEVLGVAGLVGAGRTELLRAVFGLDPVVSGEVRVGAYSSSRSWKPSELMARGVGLSSEDRQGEGLAPDQSVARNMTLSRLDGLGPAGLVLPHRVESAARRWVESLGIHCRSTSQPVSSLSGGNQQKVALARLLHHDLDVLLLDEPTRGIDVGAKAAIYELIDRLATEGKAIVLVSSYLPELLGMSDRIAVMRRGVLGESRPARAWDAVSVMAACVEPRSSSSVSGERA